jgi:hypothetical protein
MRGRTALISASIVGYVLIALQWRDRDYFGWLLVMGLVPGGALLGATVTTWRTGLASRRGVSVTLGVLSAALMLYLAVLLYLGIPSDG